LPGSQAGGAPSSHAELFDPTSNVFTALADIPTVTQSDQWAATAMLDGRAMVSSRSAVFAAIYTEPSPNGPQRPRLQRRHRLRVDELRRLRLLRHRVHRQLPVVRSDRQGRHLLSRRRDARSTQSLQRDGVWQLLQGWRVRACAREHSLWHDLVLERDADVVRILLGD
jgi:hypothetical protein